MNRREHYNDEHNLILNQINEVICRNAEQGDGVVDVNIERQPFRGHSEYKICAPNLSLYSSSISGNKLRGDLSELHDRSTNKKAFGIFKTALLEVLNDSGFGDIYISITKKKKETVVMSKITISRRHTI